LWKTRIKTGQRLRGRIERVLAFAKGRGLRDGENPARWSGHLSEMLAAPSRVAVEHVVALPYQDVPAFLANLRSVACLAARAMEFTVLTVGRTGEVIGARRSEVNFAEKVWTIPRERMKGAKQHRVPLSDRAIEILQALPHHGERFFELRPEAMIKLMRRL